MVAVTGRRRVRNYLEMVLAMAAGMIILGPVVEVVGTALGVGVFLTQPDIAAVVMASSPCVVSCAR
jgi:hypothetical protein